MSLTNQSLEAEDEAFIFPSVLPNDFFSISKNPFFFSSFKIVEQGNISLPILVFKKKKEHQSQKTQIPP